MGGRATLDLLWLWEGQFRGAPARPIPRLRPHVREARQQPKQLRNPEADGPSLADYKHRKRTRPRSLSFSDGSSEDVSKWADVPLATVRWLARNNKLTPSMCPLTTRRGTHLVHTQKDRYHTPQQVEELWLERQGSAEQLIENAKQIIEACGERPTEVRVTIRT